MSKQAIDFDLKITAKFESQTGETFYQVEGAKGEALVSKSDCYNGKSAFYMQLSERTGVGLAGSGRQSAFRALVDAASLEATSIMAATRPGWMGTRFVTGDGRILPSGAQPIDHVTFSPIAKFAPIGTLKQWQTNIEPFVTRQDLPLLVIGLALAGPIMRFLPSDVLNPQVELVGEHGAGKTIMGAVAASVWSGCPGRSGGGGDSWNITVATYDRIRNENCNMIVVLDEAEQSSGRTRAASTKAVVFEGSGSDEKRRQTDLSRPEQAARHAVLSTSNTPLSKVLAREGQQSLSAARSRMPTLFVARDPSDGQLSIFSNLDRLPVGAEAAAGGLRQAVDNAYGTAGPAFVEALAKRLLVEDDATALRLHILDLYETAMSRLTEVDGAADVRHRQMLATVETSLTLANEFGVVPRKWGNPTPVIWRIFATLATPEGQERIAFKFDVKRLRAAVSRELAQGRIADQRARKKPKLLTAQKGAVYTSKGTTYVAFLPEYLEGLLPQGSDFENAMKRRGLLMLTESESDRHTIKAPKPSGLERSKRVVVMKLGEFD